MYKTNKSKCRLHKTLVWDCLARDGSCLEAGA